MPATRTGTVLSTSVPSRKDWLRAFTYPFCHGWGAAPRLCCKASPGCYLTQEGRQKPWGFASGVFRTRLATGYFHRALSIGTVWAKTCASRLGMLAMQHTRVTRAVGSAVAVAKGMRKEITGCCPDKCKGSQMPGWRFAGTPGGCHRRVGGGRVRARAGPGCSPGTAAAPRLALLHTGRSTSFPLLQSLRFQSRRRLGWGVNKAGMRRRRFGSKEEADAKEGGKGGRNAEEKEELDVDETPENSADSGSGFDAGLHAASTHANCSVFGRCP